MNEFELEQQKSRAEVAEYLRQLADGLEGGDRITLVTGEESTTMHPPEEVHLKIETDSNNSWLGEGDGQSFRLEIGWEATDVEPSDELTIIQQPDQPTRTERTERQSTEE